jgi:AraC-like DNA-binding protein
MDFIVSVIKRRVQHIAIIFLSILAVDVLVWMMLSQGAEFELLGTYDEETNRLPGSYHENHSDSASIAELKGVGMGYDFDYKKSVHIENSFAAAYFPLDHLNETLGHYDALRIRGDFGKARRVPVLISLHYDSLKVRYITEFIEIEEGNHEYELLLENFKTPVEWYEHHNLDMEEYKVLTLENARTISISSCHLLESGIQDSYQIRSITFVKDRRGVLWVGLGISAAVLLLSALWVLVLGAKKKEMISVPMEDIDLEEARDVEALVIQYIGQHYMNSNLTVGLISKAIGFHKLEVSKVLKEKYELSFPQYLSWIRVESAKKLLVVDGFTSVSDVGYEVGFNSPNNFTRVFKTLEGVSPSEFISQQSDNQ